MNFHNTLDFAASVNHVSWPRNRLLMDAFQIATTARQFHDFAHSNIAYWNIYQEMPTDMSRLWDMGSRQVKDLQMMIDRMKAEFHQDQCGAATPYLVSPGSRRGSGNNDGSSSIFESSGTVSMNIIAPLKKLERKRTVRR